MKTGTPCRIHARSVRYDALEEQPGDAPPPRLSHWSRFPGGRPPLPQVSCHLTHTTPRTHEIIRAALHRSPLYTGRIDGVGPRYCPSVEDKVVRFPERERHLVFLEPEGLSTPEVYPNGISTSLPADVQEALVRSIPGLERAEILRPGYAVEYDHADPRQLDPTLEVRGVAGLFLAGQICGTSGYEEAAGQGMLAGINAARHLAGEAPLVLRRDQAYIGVMVDDLTTRGTTEPYRMFTSRAEYRLLLREDNAAERLTPLGRELGLIDDARWRRFEREQRAAEALERALERTTVGVDDRLGGLLQAEGSPAPRPEATLQTVLRRPEVTLELLARAGRLPPEATGLDDRALERTEIRVKYHGYIDNQRRDAARLARLEHTAVPAALDYAAIVGLRTEVREKLTLVRPTTLGQAARIPGVTPAAVALLEVHLRRE